MTDLIPRDAAIEEAFMDAVWDALKADATDLGKQQRILTAVRAIPAIDPAAIREAALKEAASECQRIAGNTKDFIADHRRAAGQCAAMILAMIGEKK